MSVCHRSSSPLVDIGIVVRNCRLGGLGLVLSYTIEVDHAATKVNVIARHSDNTLYQKKVFTISLFRWLVEDDDVSATHITVGQKRCPFRSRS